MSQSIAKDLNTATLFERLGGPAGIRRIVDGAVAAHMRNPVIQHRFRPYADRPERLQTDIAKSGRRVLGAQTPPGIGVAGPYAGIHGHAGPGRAEQGLHGLASWQLVVGQAAIRPSSSQVPRADASRRQVVVAPFFEHGRSPVAIGPEIPGFRATAQSGSLLPPDLARSRALGLTEGRNGTSHMRASTGWPEAVE